MNIDNPSDNKNMSKNKRPVFQKKIIKDENIGDFFSQISQLETFIFDKLNDCINSDADPLEIAPTSSMIKLCNSILDMKKKQLEIRRITNYSSKIKDIKNKKLSNVNYSNKVMYIEEKEPWDTDF